MEFDFLLLRRSFRLCRLSGTLALYLLCELGAVS
jgi:hypothetical protein